MSEKKISDREYLYLSAMLKAREANMLTRDKLERMLAAGTFADAAKLLQENGWPDMSGEDGQVSDQTAQLMILWIGVMMGAQGAQAAVRSLLDVIRAQVERKVLEAALNKTWVYGAVQQICKWIGVKLSEEGFAKAVGKVIPLVGAPISAGITYFTFTPMCKKLKKELDFQWENLKFPEAPGSQKR